MKLSATELAAQASGEVLVDVRRAEEWQLTGVIAGSHLLTFFDAAGNADPVGWLDALAKTATPADELVLICRSDQRSGVILDFLHHHTDYRQARHLAGGILAWLEEGLPLVAFTG